jgi:hypothetical protein
VVTIFAAIGFFFTVKLGRIADRSVLNEYYPIEGTDFGVRYGAEKPDGIAALPSGLYRGGENSRELLLEGTFGYDWGAAAASGCLWLNEYSNTDLGLMHCHLVRVDLETFRRETVFEDTVLRGKCASGELVCLRGCLLPANAPEVNPLCELYCLAAADLRSDGRSAEVLWLDPTTGEVLYRLRDPAAATEAFEERYLLRSLGEVRG